MNTKILSVNSIELICENVVVGYTPKIILRKLYSGKITGSCANMIFFDAKIAEVFNRGFAHRSAQRCPLQIKLSNGSVNNIWIDDIDHVYHGDQRVYAKDVKFEAESVSNINVFKVGD